MIINDIVMLFAIFGVTFALKESSGPFGMFSKLRNLLVNNSYTGVFFYGLFSCYFCLGCDVSWILYLLTTTSFNFMEMILWMFAGGAFSLVVSNFLLKE